MIAVPFAMALRLKFYMASSGTAKRCPLFSQKGHICYPPLVALAPMVFQYGR